MTTNRINKSRLPLREARFALFLVVMLSMQLGVNADEPNWPKPPYTMKQLRAWHKSMEPWPWLGLPEQKVHLRNKKDYELLLAISGYARGGTFVLFAKRNGVWSQISDEIEQAHHPLHILKTKNNGWYDFKSFVPLWGSGGKEVFVSTYSWNGKRYVLKKSEDGMWCDYEPFKGDIQLCPAR